MCALAAHCVGYFEDLPADVTQVAPGSVGRLAARPALFPDVLRVYVCTSCSLCVPAYVSLLVGCVCRRGNAMCVTGCRV